jgi:hypothetical protein
MRLQNADRAGIDSSRRVHVRVRVHVHLVLALALAEPAGTQIRRQARGKGVLAWSAREPIMAPRGALRNPHIHPPDSKPACRPPEDAIILAR